MGDRPAKKEAVTREENRCGEALRGSGEDESCLTAAPDGKNLVSCPLACKRINSKTH